MLISEPPSIHGTDATAGLPGTRSARASQEGKVQREGLTIEALRGRHTCSIDEAGELLGIGRSTAYAAARAGDIPTLHLGRRLLVPTAKLLVMLGVEERA